MKKTLALISLLLVFSLCSCNKENYTTRVNDIEFFINESYAEGSKDSFEASAGKGAKRFFPPYEEIEYQYSDINFYMYWCCEFFTFPDGIYVLELVFDNADEYQKTKDDIYSTYDFLQEPVKDGPFSFVMPACEYKIGDFLVKILTEGEDDYFPKYIYAICENDSEQIIRYLYVYDADMDAMTTLDFRRALKKYSNCEW